MRIVVENPKENSVNLMRRLGYGFQKQVSDREIAFIRPLGRSGFPRFHVYMKKEGNAFLLDIHIDRHKETYGKTTAHHGEYEDDGALADEVRRIENML